LQSQVSLRGPILLSSFLTAGLLCGCARQPEKSSETKQPAKRVQAYRAREMSVEQTVFSSGSLAAQDRAVLSAKVPGRMERLLIDLGSSVRKGDLLAQIEKSEFELKRRQAEAAVAQARARLGLSLTGEDDKAEPASTSLAKEARAVLAEATKNRDRVVKLREQGIVPDADVETAEAQYQVAVNRYDESLHEAKNRIATLQQRVAELGLAEQELKDTEFRAPFDGVVEARQTSAGEFLNAGTPVLTLVRIDPIRARLEVAEKDAPRIRLDQKVYLHVEGLEQSLEGRIGRLSPVISAGNRMLLIEADLPNPSGILRPGAFARADIVINENAPAIFVPASAVVNFAGLQKIFVIESGKAVEKEISVKRRRGEQVEIESGIKAGELIVVEPGGLRNGQAVETNSRES
jgi:RND family efflux transporter MFP subunit